MNKLNYTHGIIAGGINACAFGFWLVGKDDSFGAIGFLFPLIMFLGGSFGSLLGVISVWLANKQKLQSMELPYLVAGFYYIGGFLGCYWGYKLVSNYTNSSGCYGGIAGGLICLFIVNRLVKMRVTHTIDLSLSTIYEGKNRKLRRIGKVIIFLVVVSAIIWPNYKSNVEAENARKSMVASLQEHYGLEFEVGKPYQTGSFRTYEALAYPKGQPAIKFKVKQGYDNYLLIKWNYQGKMEVEKKLRAIYGEQADFRISSCSFFFGDAYKDLDFTQALEKTRGNDKTKTELSYDVFIDGFQFKQDEEAKKAFEVIKTFVLDHDKDHFNFSVVYIDKADKQDFLANSKPYYRNWSFLYYDKLTKRNKYEQEIEGKNMLGYLRVFPSSSKPAVINDASDLIKYFGPYAVER